MTLAVGGARRDAGVSVADVNLTHIWDVVTQIRVGRSGRAYVVDGEGRLIAHPDISLVLRNTDLSRLPQVKFALDYAGATDPEPARIAVDTSGQRVLTAYAKATPLNWFVFVELPEHEANQPLYAAVRRSSIVLAGGLILALLAALMLARQIVVPIRALTAGAARIGAGTFEHRIEIKTGDELETLAKQLNNMAAQLHGSYATLERKVDERTHQLQMANQSKSRFLAVASHDLRQPLHALNLFVAQLRTEIDEGERKRLTARIDAAVRNMNELFNALLDISKLDAGALNAAISDFPVNSVLKRMESLFTAPAREKGLRFRIVPCRAWIRSDAILLERILLNLVSNAIRYTSTGSILLGCRQAGPQVRIEVHDTGVGVPEHQHDQIFGEFYQIAGRERDGREGLGLGLAIVERLCDLLNHPIGFSSTVGKGSCFFVSVPKVSSRRAFVKAPPEAIHLDLLAGKLVVVIDDDELVRDGTGGLLRSWGCRVITAQPDSEVVASLNGNKPDLIISDFRLGNGRSGIDAITQLRHVFQADITAFLISGDISSERLHDVRKRGYQLLHKPLAPMALRAMMSRLVTTKS
jgi:signal transduction histidine kinase